MFLKKDKRAQGRTFLTIVKGYRDPVTKKSKHKQVLKIGYLDELQKEFEDPIAHFKNLAIKMTEEEDAERFLEIKLDTNETLNIGDCDFRNIGYLALSKMYHMLGIHQFLTNRERSLKASISLNNIMKLLVYERILNPGSKKAAYENREQYFENFNFEERTLFRAFPHFNRFKDKLLLDLHQNISINYSRDTTNVFYDVTNYYFHIDQQTDLIRKGPGKDKKGKPIIQMGLLLDNDGIPISYKLFSGNTTDFVTLLPILADLKSDYNLKKVIVVADKGLNSGSNKAYNIIKGDGYIFSRSIRGTKANQEIKDYVLSKDDYREIGDEGFKLKSKVMPTMITIKDENGVDKKVEIDEKHVAFFSPKYAKRAKHKRNEIIEKANGIIDSKLNYTNASNYGAMKYIIGMKLDKTTGELTEEENVKPFLNTDIIEEEEKYDGYYSIVTSELDMPDEEIIERYRGLWRIEESFKVTKSSLETRPVFVRREDSIEAHFLTCYISLVILRLLQKELGNKYSVDRIVNSLNKATVMHLNMNNYKAGYYDEILKEIQEKIEIRFNQKYITLDEIKKMQSSTKI